MNIAIRFFPMRMRNCNAKRFECKATLNFWQLLEPTYMLKSNLMWIAQKQTNIIIWVQIKLKMCFWFRTANKFRVWPMKVFRSIRYSVLNSRAEWKKQQLQLHIALKQNRNIQRPIIAKIPLIDCNACNTVCWACVCQFQVHFQCGIV